MPTYALGHVASAATEIQAKDLTIIGHTKAADASPSAPHITTLLPAIDRDRNDAIAVSEAVTIDGKELAVGLWYLQEDTAAATIDDFAKLPGGSDGTLELPEILTGAAVERRVDNANRDSIRTFGDFQFRVPTAGGSLVSSLQYRYLGGGAIPITAFSTVWSNQQGGASEQTINYSLGSSWRYFRDAGLNLTQHNNYQNAEFISNGWLYHVRVIVGSGWTNNKFSFTRWRLEGVKGDAGADGVDGTDGTSIDHLSQTAGNSAPGTSNTYTLWGDAAETIDLGSYDVPIATPADYAQPLEDLIAEGNGSWTADESITLAGNDGGNVKTWNDLLADGYEKVFINAKETGWRNKNVSGYFFIADIIRDGGAELWTVASGSNRYEVTVANVTGVGTGFTVINGGTGGHSDFKMYGVRPQKELLVVNPADAVIDTALVGTPLNAGSAREYVLQWNGTEIVNTLAKEKWTVGNNEYIIDHLTRHMTIIGESAITSSGTISWSQAFSDTGYTFAHDLREAQSDTASLRINSRTTSSITYTLFDSVGTGDGGSQVNYTITGRIA